MKLPNRSFLLRIPLAIILLTHSLIAMYNGGVNDFGNLYLNEIGFAPLGVPIAWLIKLSHLAAALCFITNRYVKPAGWVTIMVLLAGIIMVHLPNGWFVVGDGQNGVEYNFLLIFVTLYLMDLKVFS